MERGSPGQCCSEARSFLDLLPLGTLITCGRSFSVSVSSFLTQKAPRLKLLRFGSCCYWSFVGVCFSMHMSALPVCLSGVWASWCPEREIIRVLDPLELELQNDS